MPINTVQLCVYPRTFISSSHHNNLQHQLSHILGNTLTYAHIPTVDIFMLINPFHNHVAGKPDNRLVIFINGTEKSSNDNKHIVLDTNSPLFGIESPFTDFLPPNGGGIVIKSPEGIPVAEWFDDFWELNILFDLFDDNVNLDNKLAIFTAIMKAFNEQIFYQKTVQQSWKFGNQQSKLCDTFCSLIKHHREQNVSNDKRQIQQWERDIAAYQTAIKQLHDQLFQKRRQLNADEDYLNEILTTFENDLNILVQHEKIKDVHIDNQFVTIFTVPLRIYASNNKIYQGGEYTIKINMFDSNVTFDSNCKHSSFWSTQDPHPHVDGQTKKACFGNIDSTIAELCSQMQLYALVMILIDFLESANTADAAGKCVVNWPEIDKDGNLIIKDNDDCNDDDDNNDDCDDNDNDDDDNNDDCDDNDNDDDEEDDYHDCDCCGGEYHVEDLYSVYNNICRLDNDVIPTNHRFVCINCRDDYYHWSNSLEEYISDEVHYDD